ncbi:MAG: hypothetical protein LBE91_14655 [Tannerella sp.]|jgi:hypothetical protein|nr:hypothetical protein [Tannerella sp.]
MAFLIFTLLGIFVFSVAIFLSFYWAKEEWRASKSFWKALDAFLFHIPSKFLEKWLSYTIVMVLAGCFYWWLFSRFGADSKPVSRQPSYNPPPYKEYKPIKTLGDSLRELGYDPRYYTFKDGLIVKKELGQKQTYEDQDFDPQEMTDDDFEYYFDYGEIEDL